MTRITNAAARPRFTARPLALALSNIFGATALLAAPAAMAAPQDGNVTAGQASIRQSGNLTTVTQGSQRAAIDWRSFNVASNETVNFIQPNASAAILNRVVGNDASAIFGRITANGQVYLINPNGILFGRSAQVDVGALTASTANIANADFMAGRMLFGEPGKAGAKVENEGRITVAEGGFAALVGRQVANHGVISARLGKVALAAGDAFVLDLYGDRLVNLVVDPTAMGTLTDASGRPLAASVNQAGEVVAEGGRIELSVATVKQLVDNLINVSGVVRATSFTSAPGVISLHGDAHTQVAVSGTLDASGERGGRIEVTGREVALQPGAVLAATGGQGQIAVGGGWQGSGPLAHAERVNVAQGASLDASGGTRGQGGTVVLWSDRDTQFSGRIAVAGGTQGGDAGQVEVSSKGRLGFQGDVNLFATKGLQGSLLLDPLNLTIGAVASGDSQVSAEQLRFFLTRGASVNLSADQNVTVDAEVNGLVAGGGVAGGGLTLTAGNNLAVNQNIVLNDGALNLTATGGTLSQAAGTVLYTGNGNATLRGGAGVNLGQLAAGGAVDIRSGGTVNVNNAIVAASANGSAAPVASLNVEGVGAVNLNGALVQGNATVRSTAGAVNLAGAVIQSQAGNVQVNAGTTLTSAAANIGLVAQNGTVTATSGQSMDLGVAIGGSLVSLRSVAGDVTLRQAATGGASSAVHVMAEGGVALAGVNAGTGGIAIGANTGNITSVGGGLVSTGDISVQASAGQAGTTASPLSVQAAGNAAISGETGVSVDTVLSRGNVDLDAFAGNVTVARAISGDSGTVNSATVNRPNRIDVTAGGTVTLAGGAAGTGGIHVNSSAGAVNLNGSLFSAGPVDVAAEGAVTLADGAGIDTTRADSGRNLNGRVGVTSRSGAVTIGTGGIRTNGNDAFIHVSSAGDLAINGDLKTDNDQIHLTAGGAVRVRASYTDDSQAANATLDAGTDTSRSAIFVVSQGGNVELGEMIAYGLVSVIANGGSVILKRGLGGNASGTFGGNPVLLNTGYVDYARGYLPQYRPNVGQLTITARDSVELNGLNLDGNADPTNVDPGLSVTAGQRIVSNREIAVNKGDIVLASSGNNATDGVYLGNSVYSRGYDSVGADGVRGGGDDLKLGYGIRIAGRVLGLFDNTLEMARLPVQTYRLAWYEAGPGAPPPLHDVRTDASGFIVDAAGIRVRNPDGSYQQVGYLTGSFDPSDSSLPASGLAIYNVNATGVVVAGQTGAGTQVVGVAGQPNAAVTQEIAKIEIANNTANYQDPANAGTLVAPTAGSVVSRQVQVNTITIAGVGNHTPQTAMRLGDPLPTLVAPSQAPIVSAPADAGAVGATRGIGLKLLGFAEAGDQSSVVWSTRVQAIDDFGPPFFSANDGNGGFLTPPSLSTLGLASTTPVDGRFTVTLPALASRTYTDTFGNTGVQTVVVPTNGGTAVVVFQATDATLQRATVVSATVTGANASLLSGVPDPSGGGTVGAWTFSAWRAPGESADFRLVTPALRTPGSSAAVTAASAIYPSTAAGTVTPAFSLSAPAYTQRTPFLEVDRTDTSTAPRAYTVSQALYDVQSGGTRPGTRVFVYDGVINGAGGFFSFDSNTGVAIPGVGGIPGFNNSTVGFAGVGAGFGSLGSGTAGSTGVGGVSGQGAGGVTIPGAGAGAGTVPSIDDRSAQDAASGAGGAPTGGPGLADVVFGVRVAAEADLGRGAAVPGSAINVFKRRYRLASAPAGTACAPEAVQQVPATDGGPARDCPAK